MNNQNEYQSDRVKRKVTITKNCSAMLLGDIYFIKQIDS